jgi:hypothetical protein
VQERFLIVRWKTNKSLVVHLFQLTPIKDLSDCLHFLALEQIYLVKDTNQEFFIDETLEHSVIIVGFEVLLKILGDEFIIR